MARIRTIKPTFFTSLTITQLSRDARLTFAGLWTYCDDEGRGVDDARLIKSALWPLDDDITARDVGTHLAAAARLGLVIRYEVAGRKYLAVRNFREHQKISKPQASKFPAPPDGTFPPTSAVDHHDAPEPSVDDSPFPPDDSGNVPGMLPEDSRIIPGGKGKEGKGKEGSTARGAVPERSGNGSHPTVVAERPDAPPAEPDAWLVLHAEWEKRVGPVDKGRFRKAFRPVCEPEGGRDMPYPLPVLRRAIERYAARKRGTREWAFVKPEQFVAGLREHVDIARMEAQDFVKLLPLPAGAA